MVPLSVPFSTFAPPEMTAACTIGNGASLAEKPNLNAILPALGIGDLVPIVGMLISITVFMIPIIAILTSHQRKMAEIIHAKESATRSAEVQALRQEVAELKTMVCQQMLALDSYANLRQPNARTSEPATDNLGGGLGS